MAVRVESRAAAGHGDVPELHELSPVSWEEPEAPERLHAGKTEEPVRRRF